MSEPVVAATRDGVRVLTLNRPETRNALTAEMREGLVEAVVQADRDPDVRAILITGSSGSFCAGGDVKGMAGRPTVTWLDHMEMIKRELVRPLLDTRKPIVAAVNGWAVGAGVSIALACDIRIASESSKFSLAFVGVGLVPDMAALHLLPRTVGLGAAKRLALLGERITARDALRCGLVSEVVADDRISECGLELASKLAAGPTKSIGLIKQLLNSSFETGLDAALRTESLAQTVAAATADHAEAVQAFIDRRTPRFQGQ